MAGITDWPLRVLCYRMGAEYACSEMVSAIGYLCAKPGNRVYTQLLQVHPEETNTACQLFGKDPVVMGEAAQRITELGRFRSLDINMGCPARKVVSIGEGSALLLNPDQAYKVSTVARLCGFTDEKYFMKLFKRYEGMTPSQYRNTFHQKKMNLI